MGLSQRRSTGNRNDNAYSTLSRSNTLGSSLSQTERRSFQDQEVMIARPISFFCDEGEEVAGHPSDHDAEASESATPYAVKLTPSRKEEDAVLSSPSMPLELDVAAPGSLLTFVGDADLRRSSSNDLMNMPSASVKSHDSCKVFGAQLPENYSTVQCSGILATDSGDGTHLHLNGNKPDNKDTSYSTLSSSQLPEEATYSLVDRMRRGSQQQYPGSQCILEIGSDLAWTSPQIAVDGQVTDDASTSHVLSSSDSKTNTLSTSPSKLNVPAFTKMKAMIYTSVKKKKQKSAGKSNDELQKSTGTVNQAQSIPLVRLDSQERGVNSFICAGSSRDPDAFPYQKSGYGVDESGAALSKTKDHSDYADVATMCLESASASEHSIFPEAERVDASSSNSSVKGQASLFTVPSLRSEFRLSPWREYIDNDDSASDVYEQASNYEISRPHTPCDHETSQAHTPSDYEYPRPHSPNDHKPSQAHEPNDYEVSQLRRISDYTTATFSPLLDDGSEQSSPWAEDYDNPNLQSNGRPPDFVDPELKQGSKSAELEYNNTKAVQSESDLEYGSIGVTEANSPDFGYNNAKAMPSKWVDFGYATGSEFADFGYDDPKAISSEFADFGYDDPKAISSELADFGYDNAKAVSSELAGPGYDKAKVAAVPSPTSNENDPYAVPSSQAVKSETDAAYTHMQSSLPSNALFSERGDEVYVEMNNNADICASVK